MNAPLALGRFVAVGRLVSGACWVAAAAAIWIATGLPARAADTPRFAVRGTLPWHNFLSGPSAWNEDDYRAYLDRLAALRMNFVGFHCYTGGAERYAPYVEPILRIAYRDVVPSAGFDTSLTARWGYRPLPIERFAFGTGRLFGPPRGDGSFGADCAVLARDNEDRYRRAQALMGKVVGMAHDRGLQAAIGFEFGIHPPELASIVPPDSRIPGAGLPDPTHPANIEILHATLDDLLRAYPSVDWVWLWLHEHTMYVPKAKASGAFQKLLSDDGRLFGDAGDDAAAFTGVWSLAHIRQAHAYLKRKAPRVRLAIGGWGGGPQLPPVLIGLDRALPADIVLTCLNTDRHPESLATIAKHRPVWAIPWLEHDGALWHLQPRVTTLLAQVQAADRDKFSGVLAIHWRTEEIQVNLDAFAQAANRPGVPISVEDVYRDDCRRRYGPESVATLAPLLARMDRENRLGGLSSPEFFPYDPQWGRITTETARRLRDAIALVEGLRRGPAEPGKKTSESGTDRPAAAVGDASTGTPGIDAANANLEWLADNFRFTLLLDHVGRKMEPAYRLHQRWLCGELSGEPLARQASDARRALRSAPVGELFQVYARRVRSRGELGELSALNQKLYPAYRDLERFVDRIAQR